MLSVESPIKLGELKINNSHVFTANIVNIDNTTINVLEIFVGCQSCTTVSMPKRVIHANETVQLSATFTPKTTGDHSKTITIRYREGNTESRLILNFSATVVR